MEIGWQGISNATVVGGVWRRSDVAQAAYLLACALHTYEVIGVCLTRIRNSFFIILY